MTVVEQTGTGRPPLWRDVRVLRVLAQTLAVGVVLSILYVLWFNLTNNLRAAGLPTDFDFLNQPLGVDIPGSDISPSAPIWKGLLNGVKNTMALVVVGIPLLTIIGMLVALHKSLRVHGAGLVFLAPRPLVGEVLRMAGIDRAIPIEDGRAAALKRFGLD